MDAILMLLTAMAGWGFAVFLTINNRLDERDARTAHADDLRVRDERIEQLIDQVQLNAQNMPYYPQIGPFPADTAPEKKYLGTDDGLLVVDEDELTEAFAEIDRLG